MNTQQNPEQCYGVYDKWPDFLEVWRQTEDDPGKLKFVLIRKNNRSLQTDQMTLLRLLEMNGLNVVVRVGTIDLTLDQFEKGMGYKFNPNTQMLAQSTFYNKRSELKRWEQVLVSMSSTDPRRENVVQRISQLNEQLGLNEPGVSQEVVDKSADGLLSVGRLLLLEQTDESIAEMNLIDLHKQMLEVGIERLTPTWEAIVNKWAKARQKHTEELNERKPDTAG